jgi:predicted phosphodiesterase
MALTSTATSQTFVGNGSTVIAYPITFQFLDPSHIYIAISEDGEEEPVLQDQSAFSIVGANLYTVEAVEDPAEITIFRVLPFTQPSVFQPQGPFPAGTVETALDRLTMQVQQLNTRLLVLEGDDPTVPSGGAGGSGVLTWADETARAAVVPAYAGQLGTEQETQTVWIAQSTSVGDWEPFAKRFTNRLVIGLLADAGSPGAGQTAAALALEEWEPDAVIFAGDNNYSGAENYDSDWAAFEDWIDAGKAFPALGNHDVDEDGWQTRHAAKFPYLPGNKRYYVKTLRDGLVDLFVLHSGRDSVFDLVEPDGNDVDSAQHAWFVEQLAASRARWKIAVFHHPPVTINEDTESRIEPNMAWPELAQMDLICCGHNHLLELVKYQNVLLATMGAVVNTAATAGGVLQGGSYDDQVVWADDENTGLARIVASEEKLTVEVWNAKEFSYGSDRRLLHIRDVRDFSKAPWFRESFTILPPDVEADLTATDFYVHTLPAAMMLRGVEVSNAVGSPNTFDCTLKAGVVTVANVTIDADEVRGVADHVLAPNEVLPAGTVLTLDWVTDTDRFGCEDSLTFERHS